MMKVYKKDEQAYGAFNNGEIIENKPLGFPSDGGELKPYSNLFYWANAIAKVDSTIGLHPHQGFEIMSFVLEGTIRHFDTKHNEWKELHAGDVQIIRSGNGISHAEHMGENSRMFQIWLDPNLSQSLSKEASYTDYPGSDFKAHTSDNVTKTTYAGKEGIMELDSDVIIEKWDVAGDAQIDTESGTITSIYILDGNLQVNGKDINTDDFSVIEDTLVNIKGTGSVFVIQNPKSLGYTSYFESMKARLRN